MRGVVFLFLFFLGFFLVPPMKTLADRLEVDLSYELYRRRLWMFRLPEYTLFWAAIALDIYGYVRVAIGVVLLLAIFFLADYAHAVRHGRGGR
jgi:hypothetical protein